MTKKYRRLYWFFAIISLFLNIGPLAAYSVIGLIGADLVVEKVALATTIFIVLILSAVAFINKTTMRSRVWVILLGLYACLDYILAPLLVIAITQIIDEWFISPAAKSFRNKLIINKQIDKRMA